ncbi:MAG: hypothetical protein QGG00_10375 [Verrucomicrobiota bacterium]|nr:hypothetical protein [Verrucomicrobiota bacterium]
MNTTFGRLAACAPGVAAKPPNKPSTTIATVFCIMDFIGKYLPTKRLAKPPNTPSVKTAP